MAFADLAAFWEQIRGSHPIDPARVVLAGFSQGGNLALRAALQREPFASSGVLGVCPSFPGEAAHTMRLIETASGPPLSVAFLLGVDDVPYTESAKRVLDALDRAGHRVHLEVVAGLGHALPADFEARLPGLLDLFVR